MTPERPRVAVFGGTGFVGTHVASRLASHYAVDVLSRNPDTHPQAKVAPHTRLLTCDLRDGAQVRARLDGAQAAINLIGILNERKDDGAGFHRAHVETTQSIVDACRQVSVPRFLQMSALKVDVAQSHYAKSKLAAEEVVKSSGLDWTILRPSVIFGPGDSFLSRFAGLLKWAPLVFPLAGGKSRMQPVYVGDVARAMELALLRRRGLGQTWELGGPEVMTLHEIVEFVARQQGQSTRIVDLPDALGKLQAAFLEWVPGKPFSLDNWRSLQTDNVTQSNALPALGITPRSVHAIAPQYLGVSEKQRLLDRCRSRRHG